MTSASNVTDMTAIAAAAEREPETDQLALTSECQYLTFYVGNEQYAVDILQVQEIRNISQVMPIPNSPPHVRGVVNLRGTIVPIICLRSRLGLPQSDDNRRSVVIVVHVNTRDTGLVVDAVSDVVTIGKKEQVPLPQFGDQVAANFIAGIANLGNELTLLLDLPSVCDFSLNSLGKQLVASGARIEVSELVAPL